MFIDPEYNDNEKNIIENISNKNNSIDNLLLDLSKSSNLQYRPTDDLFRITQHCGQRKLLLTEIYFISKFNEIDEILYVGAAAGSHIILLHRLFPDKTFHLFDPKEFDKNLIELSCYSNNKIFIYNRLFTNLYASKYKNRNILFISDIRTDAFTIEKREQVIPDDMELQKNWIEIMKPYASMVKFTLPWNNVNINYFKGDILIQPYAPINSTETRLIIDHNDKFVQINYNSEQYNNLLFEHNIIIREWYKYNNNPLITGLQNNDIKKYNRNLNYDCSSEILILRYYCKVFNKNIIDIIETIESSYNEHKILNKNINPYKIYDVIIERKYLYDKYYNEYMGDRKKIINNRKERIPSPISI